MDENISNKSSEYERRYEPEPLLSIDKIIVLIWLVIIGCCIYFSFNFQYSIAPWIFIDLLVLISVIAILRGIF